jgi:hypothetical protein
MSRGPSGVYNIISIVFLVLSVLVIVYVIVRLIGP